MIIRERSPRARTCWSALAICALLTPAARTLASGATVSAPAWPNLLSEAGRRAAMALPAGSLRHIEPTLEDLEAAARLAPTPNPEALYERWRGIAVTPANVRANDPTGDQGAAPSTAADTQSECAVAAFGTQVVVAWNDSKGLLHPTTTTVSGFGYSSNGGATFTDGGSVPLLASGDQSYGDCTLDVDAAGNFYLATIYVTGNQQEVSVHRGAFASGVLTWNAPVIAASVPDGTQALDKPYLTVDKATGNIYVSFTRFGPGNTDVGIEVVRGTNLGTTWTPPTVLDNTSQGIQGSRPIVGPEGNLYVCWQSDWGSLNCDLSSTTGTIALRRSLDPAGTLAFDPAIHVGTVQANWMSYWAGNLRGNGLFFPDIAVDRSGGARHGDIYVVWNEAAPWGAPGDGSGISSAETESNNTPTDPGVKTINPGDNATGNISTSGDFDYWKINVTAGSTLILHLEPQGFSCPSSGTLRNFQIRLFKGVSGTAGDSILANSNLPQFTSEILCDVAETGTYIFRVRNVALSGTVSGTYTVKTRLVTYGAPSPGRDMRDIVVARSSDHGASFQPEVRVNDDSARFDDEIPAIACDTAGNVHVFWYDARDAAGARILRSYYSSVSNDGGATWQPNHRLSNELMYYNLNTVAVPNYGEYNQAYAEGGTVYATWSDERLSHTAFGQSGVDAFVTSETITPVTITDIEAAASEGGVSLSWRLQDPSEVRGVRVQRADAAAGPYADRTPGLLAPEPAMSFKDSQVEAGRTYWYRIVLETTGGASVAGSPVRVVVTEQARLRTALYPPLEPASGGPVEIRYSVGERSDPLHLVVYDVGGHRVRTLEQGARAPGEYLRTWDRRDDSGARVARGVYMVQLRTGAARQARKLVLRRD